MGDWLQWADRSVRGAIPVTVTVMLVFAASLPWRLPAFVEVTPAFAVMAVFYWTIYRPERFPYAATFGIGVLQDLLAATPLGMTALVLLIVQGVVASQRTFFRGKPFLVVWWGFSWSCRRSGCSAGSSAPPASARWSRRCPSSCRSC